MKNRIEISKQFQALYAHRYDFTPCTSWELAQDQIEACLDCDTTITEYQWIQGWPHDDEVRAHLRIVAPCADAHRWKSQVISWGDGLMHGPNLTTEDGLAAAYIDPIIDHTGDIIHSIDTLGIDAIEIDPDGTVCLHRPAIRIGRVAASFDDQWRRVAASGENYQVTLSDCGHPIISLEWLLLEMLTETVADYLKDSEAWA